MAASEEQLIMMAKDGNEAGVEGLYRQYFEAMYRFCYWQTNKSADAEDLTQDIFVEMAKSIRTFKGDSSFKNWLYTIAKHKISSWIKQKYRLPTVELYETIPDKDDWIDPDNTELKVKTIRDLFARLSALEKKVMMLRYIHNSSVEETAKTLKISLSNVKVICHRCIKKLRKDVTG